MPHKLEKKYGDGLLQFILHISLLKQFYDSHVAHVNKTSLQAMIKKLKLTSSIKYIEMTKCRTKAYHSDISSTVHNVFSLLNALATDSRNTWTECTQI